MPNERGALSELEKETARKWIVERIGNACPACRRDSETTSVIVDHIVHWEAYAPTVAAFGFGGLLPSYPAVLVLCLQCGHFRAHSAILMGIVPIEKPSQEESTPEARHGN
jgi:hypothetical protein